MQIEYGGCMTSINSSEKKLKLLASNKRLAILLFLDKQKTATVSEISEALSTSIYGVSQHLRILRGPNMVLATRRGNNVSYRLPLKKDPLIKAVLMSVKSK